MQITFEKSSAVVSPIVVNNDNTMDITYTTNRDKAYRFDITDSELVANLNVLHLMVSQLVSLLLLLVREVH